MFRSFSALLSLLVPALLQGQIPAATQTESTPAPAITAAPAEDDPAAVAAAAERVQAEAARSILESWRASGDGDVRAERPLLVVLFTGNDTEPAAGYRERLSRTMNSVRDFYAREMERHGFGPLTFPLEHDEDGLVTIHVVRGAKANLEYEKKDGDAIYGEVKAALAAQDIDSGNRTLVLFCNLTVWDPQERSIRHHSPYYAIGSSTRGRAWQLDSVLLDPASLTDTNPDHFVHDGEYGHISLGKYNSYFIGGVAHELGHALGLPHNSQTDEHLGFWGHALMGAGNRTFGEELRGEGKGSYLTIAHALRLASHPSFTGSVRDMNRQPQSRYAELSLEPLDDGRGVRVIGRVESDIPVYGVIGYIDPAGDGDYNSISVAAVPSADGRFQLDCRAFSGERGDLRLVKLHANGWGSFSQDRTIRWTRDPQSGAVQLTLPDNVTEPSPPTEPLPASRG